MNILFLFYAPMIPYLGGVQRVTENLTVEFIKRGHSVYYFNSNIHEPNLGYDFPVPQFSVDYANNRDQAIANYINILKKYDINIVLNQEARADLLDILSYTPAGLKKITCIHLQPFFEQTFIKEILKYYKIPGIKATLFKTFCRLFPSVYANKMLCIQKKTFQLASNLSDCLCLLSESFFPRMLKFMPDIEQSKLIAVNNPNTFCNTECNLQNKRKQIIWVGRHENAQKNFPLFVDFWIEFSKQHPDWEAIVIGEGRDWKYNIKYANKKRASKIMFVGNQKDVSCYYNNASFLIQTSLYEGWGMILTEAMNYGCIPCAFDTFESVHDIIDNNINGIIVPPFNIEQLVININSAICTFGKMDALRKNAISKSSQFAVERIVDKWESIFKTI